MALTCVPSIAPIQSYFVEKYNTIAVGGSKGELFIWQLEESPIFCSQYGIKFNDNIEKEEHLKNIPKNKRVISFTP